MMLSLQNSINSRNGPGGNKNRSVWLRVGVTGVAFQAVNQPCGTQGPLAKSAVAGYIVRETVQIADSGIRSELQNKSLRAEKEADVK